MERLWSPWRHAYVTGADASKSGGCIFCEAQKSRADDEKNLVLYRGVHNFIILNRYPYTSGHLMIAPHVHIGDLDAIAQDVSNEMMDLIKRSQDVLRKVYQPQGFNLGMNMGRAAGAGIVDHIHMHLLPRWIGDTNFISTVGETRILPEDLAVTYQKLRKHFEG